MDQRMRELQPGRFFLPGPTEVRPEVLAAQTRPMVGHRGEEIKELMAGVQPGLKAIFRTERPVYISTSSATGFMEAAVRNGARSRVLSLVNGAFSERFYKIARACGCEADALEVDWGGVHSPELLADTLRSGGYDAVTMVHSETSTGALNPIADLAEAAHAAGDVVVLVDSVSGMGGAPVETDAWELDFVLTGAQKALALPPGLAFGVARRSVLERAERQSRRGVYFDLVDFESRIARHQTPNTPAVSLLFALEAQIAHMVDEGIENRWARHRRMAERTWAWVDEMRDGGVPLEILADEGSRSPTVTCVCLPEGMTGPDVARAMAERGYVIATGYGKMKKRCIRIGHMGEHTVEELENVLGALEEVLRAS